MTDNNLGSLVQQMAQHQRDMQEQMTRLIETLGQPKPDKTNTSKPDPFTGKANDVHRFLSLFKIWAASRSDLSTEEKTITSALSFMQGEAADWAARHANLIVKSHEPNSMQPFPFDGKWAQFEKEFKTRFGSVDEEGEARRKIKGMKQGKQSVAHYAQEFQDVGGRTSFSDADLMERFCNGLNGGIRLHMISIELGQGKAKSLAEAVNRACTIELALHNPTFNTTPNFRSSDPNAMDVDATRTGGNGKT